VPSRSASAANFAWSSSDSRKVMAMPAWYAGGIGTARDNGWIVDV
jgi:hypothetical protein